MPSTIKICNLCKCFGDIIAVNNVSFETHCGEIIALLGPNGAGKSTLMNMLTGYLAPSSGDIFIMEKNIKTDVIFSKSSIGFLSEGSPLYPDMSVGSFLNYMAELRGLYGKHKKQALEQAVKNAKIENITHQKIENLSKGYRRRVGFAQSILSNPPILLLDEPTDGLDPNQKHHMHELITRLGKNKTIIISTHLLEEAETIANRIILINKGQIMADGNLKDILKQTHSKTLNNAFKKLTITSEEV